MSAAAAGLLLAGCGSGGNAQADAAPPPAAAAPTRNQAAPPPPGAVPPAHPSPLVPPGAAVSANVPNGRESAISFESAEPPERLLDWFRSPERRPDFSLGGELQEGAEQVLTGSTSRPPGEFTVRLAPSGNGGTTAMVLITAR
jgi:hypothetical protein